ncbi:MAG: tetratricopeptide repeat protein [Acidobacteriota bacterium]|nr:tetratricopeptide repeat protein [Acidobacteriota bacterium]MDH3529324.1 tetratricopeptide repeat protein [Acidobacteriota bacterium]
MEEKKQTFRESLAISQEEFTEMGRVGAMFFEQGNLHKARTIFEGLVEMDPGSAEAHSALGAILTLNQQDQEAIVHLERAIEIDREEIAPYVNIAEIFVRQRRLEEAVAYLEKAIELDPEQTDPAANRARMIVLGIYRVIKLDNGQITTNH